MPNPTTVAESVVTYRKAVMPTRNAMSPNSAIPALSATAVNLERTATPGTANGFGVDASLVESLTHRLICGATR